MRSKIIISIVISSVMLVMTACGKTSYDTYTLDSGSSQGRNESSTESKEGGNSSGTDTGTSTTGPASPTKPSDSEGSGDDGPIPMSSVRVGDFSGTFYNRQTLRDEANNLNVAEVMVPNGWNASVSVDWSNQSKASPILAAFTIASPDQNIVIAGFSRQSFMWNYQIMTWGSWSGTKLQEHGDDEVIKSQRETSLAYRTAGEFVPFYIGKRGLSLELIQERNIDQNTYNTFASGVEASYNKAISDTIEIYKQAAPNMSIDPQGWMATMLDARYKGSMNGQTIYLDVLSAGDGANVIVHDATVDYYQTSWDNCYIFYMAAPTQELLDENREIFDTVCSNSNFHEDFEKLKSAWGAELNDMVTKSNLELLEEITAYWVEQHLKSDIAQQTQVDPISRWNEVITETDTYATTDGSSFKTSMLADGVYQNGDDFYVLPSGSTDYPQGWEELNKR